MTLFGHETPVKVYHVIGKTSDKYTVTSEIPFYIMSYKIVTGYPCTSNVQWQGLVQKASDTKRVTLLGHETTVKAYGNHVRKLPCHCTPHRL